MTLFLVASGHLLGRLRSLRYDLAGPSAFAFCEGGEASAETREAQQALVGQRVEVHLRDEKPTGIVIFDAQLTHLVELAGGTNVHLAEFGNLRGTGVTKILKTLFGVADAPAPPPGNPPGKKPPTKGPRAA